jgi:hypothetical protein
MLARECTPSSPLRERDKEREREGEIKREGERDM